MVADWAAVWPTPPPLKIWRNNMKIRTKEDVKRIADKVWVEIEKSRACSDKVHKEGKRGRDAYESYMLCRADIA